MNQPIQVDLVSETDTRGAPEPQGEILTIPEGVYRQVRIRVVMSRLAAGDGLPEKNACGNMGFNCVVMTDGRIQSLLFSGDSPELRVTPDRIENGSLVILPDAENTLLIKFKLFWALYSTPDEGVRLLPALTGNARIRTTRFSMN